MLADAREAFEQRRIDSLFLSTHSQPIHQQCTDFLNSVDYPVLVSADFDHQTTSYDGFILAVSPRLKPTEDRTAR